MGIIKVTLEEVSRTSVVDFKCHADLEALLYAGLPIQNEQVNIASTYMDAENLLSPQGARQFSEKAQQLSMATVFELLYASLKGQVSKDIPFRKCASPIPEIRSTMNNVSFNPVFYISKFQELANTVDDCSIGIPVRYQGFTKCKVWYSNEHPGWGIVARRMQHQGRVTPKRNRNTTRARNFFNIYEGYSYVLIRVPDPCLEFKKSSLQQYIIEEACKLVQIWPKHPQFWKCACILQEPVSHQRKENKRACHEAQNSFWGPSLEIPTIADSFENTPLKNEDHVVQRRASVLALRQLPYFSAPYFFDESQIHVGPNCQAYFENDVPQCF